MSYHRDPGDEALLGDLLERIAALSPADLSDYVVPKLPAWEAAATLSCAVMAAARRAAQGQADWPAVDTWRLARALRDGAPELSAVLTALLLELEEEDPPA